MSSIRQDIGQRADPPVAGAGSGINGEGTP